MATDPHRIDHALALAAQGKPDEADTLLLHLARTGPDPMAAWHLGWLRLRAGDSEGALAILREFAADPMCNERVREQLVGERRNAEALEVLKLAPRKIDDPRALVASGIEYHLAGDFAAAVTSCRRALTVAPAHAPAHNHLGRALHNLGQTAEALAEFERAVHADPRYPEAWHNLGHALRAANQLTRTCDALEQALALSPGYRSARLNLGITRYMLDQPGPALECFEYLLARNRDDGEALVNAGLCLQQLGQPAKAQQRFERALELAPDNQWAHYYLGVLQAEQGHAGKAMNSLQRALVLRPEDPDAWAEMASLLQSQGDTVKAASAVASGLRVAPDHALLNVEAARLERLRGDSLGAEARLRRIDPATLAARARQRYLRELGRALDRNARSEAALRAFEQANELAAQALALRGADPLAFFQHTDAIRAWLNGGAPGMDGVDDGDGDLGADLCFLVGFPRGCPALLATVLSGHPELAVVNERGTLETLVATLQGLPGGYPSSIARLDRSDRMALRRMYRVALGRHGVTKGVPVLDVAMLRTAHVGLVQALFPKAKLLFAARQPAEAVLANFMQPEGEPNHLVHLHRLESTVRMYDDVLSLWHQMQPRLQLPVAFVAHEDIAASAGPTLAAVCDFLGVPWDPALLAAAGGGTRSPSRRATTRANRYREALAPYRAMLAAHAQQLGYPPDSGGRD
jgi:tetratricopeptide (TPR) repeat protein